MDPLITKAETQITELCNGVPEVTKQTCITEAASAVTTPLQTTKAEKIAACEATVAAATSAANTTLGDLASISSAAATWAEGIKPAIQSSSDDLVAALTTKYSNVKASRLYDAAAAPQKPQSGNAYAPIQLMGAGFVASLVVGFGAIGLKRVLTTRETVVDEDLE